MALVVHGFKRASERVPMEALRFKSWLSALRLILAPDWNEIPLWDTHVCLARARVYALCHPLSEQREGGDGARLRFLECTCVLGSQSFCLLISRLEGDRRVACACRASLLCFAQVSIQLEDLPGGAVCFLCHFCGEQYAEMVNANRLTRHVNLVSIPSERVAPLFDLVCKPAKRASGVIGRALQACGSSRERIERHLVATAVRVEGLRIDTRALRADRLAWGWIWHGFVYGLCTNNLHSRVQGEHEHLPSWLLRPPS